MRAIRICHCTFSDAVASVPLALLHSNFLRLLLFMQNEQVHLNATCLASHVANIPWPAVWWTWQVEWCHGVSWNHINGDQLISVPATVFLTCVFCSNMFCYHLRMKPIGFHEKGQRREMWASLYLHGLSISFIPWTNLGITWLFILSWITVANQGFD